MSTWADDIVQALERLGGEAHLADIHHVVATLRPGPLPTTFAKIIQRALQAHSSDSAGFKGVDLFYSKGKGSGVWGLRKLSPPGPPELILWTCNAESPIEGQNVLNPIQEAIAWQIVASLLARLREPERFGIAMLAHGLSLVDLETSQWRIMINPWAAAIHLQVATRPASSGHTRLLRLGYVGAALTLGIEPVVDDLCALLDLPLAATPNPINPRRVAVEIIAGILLRSSFGAALWVSTGYGEGSSGSAVQLWLEEEYPSLYAEAISAPDTAALVRTACRVWRIVRRDLASPAVVLDLATAEARVIDGPREQVQLWHRYQSNGQHIEPLVDWMMGILQPNTTTSWGMKH